VITTANALFLSTNQGASWTSINGNLPLTTPTGEQPFFTIPSITSVVFNGDTLFASIARYPGALFAAGVPDPAEVEAAFAAQASADETEAFAAQQTAPLQGVFRSTDNGASWVPVNNGLGLTLGSSLLQYYSISNLTVSGTTLFANGALGLFRSTNQGDRWQRVPTPLPNLTGIPTFTLGALRQALETGQPGGTTQPTLNQIGLPISFATFLPPIAVNGKLYLAPYGSGVYVSREDGSDWLPINQGLDERALNRFFAIGNRLYCVTSSLATGGIGGAQPISTRIFTRNLAAQ